MTTYRERREARAERLREWSSSRSAKANAAHERVREIADQIPFGQPILVGHHSEGRARTDQRKIEAGMRASVENARMAGRHEERAANIERQLRESIYDDDPDAVEQLEARIARREVQRDAMKAANAVYRREHKAELAAMTPYQRSQAVPYATFTLSNLAATIRCDRDRLARLRRDREFDAAGVPEKPRSMLARFSSLCPECGEPIEKESRILYYKRQRRAIHADCGKEA